jgi:hypothetical protein
VADSRANEEVRRAKRVSVMQRNSTSKCLDQVFCALAGGARRGFAFLDGFLSGVFDALLRLIEHLLVAPFGVPAFRLSALFFGAGQTQNYYDHHAARQTALLKKHHRLPAASLLKRIFSTTAPTPA